MMNAKYASIWKLIKEYNFEFDIQKNTDLICCICNNLLKNAYQSICGCVFCLECIKTYLATDEKFCPGRANGCKELIINIQGNMQIHHAANRRISFFVVSCPIVGCDFRAELRNMVDHIATHSKGMLSNNQPVTSSHNFVDSMEKLKQEMRSMREDFDDNKIYLKEKEETITDMRQEIEELRKLQAENIEEIAKLKHEVRRLETMKPDVNYWELDDFNDIDGEPLELDTAKKRKIQDSLSLTTVNNADQHKQPHEVSMEVRQFLSSEVRVCNEDLRKKYTELKAELFHLKLNVAKLSSGKNVESIDLTGGQEAIHSNNVAENQSDKDGSDAQSNNDSRNTRRKLKRELPVAVVTTACQTTSVTTVSHTANKPCVVPSSATGTTTQAASSVKTTSTATSATTSATTTPIKTSKPTVSVVSKYPIKRPGTTTTAIQTPNKAVIHPVLLLKHTPKLSVKPPENKRMQVYRSSLADKWARPASGALKRPNVTHNRDRLVTKLGDKIDPAVWLRSSFTPFDFRVENFSRLKTVPSIFSQPFYSKKNGYKLCLRIDPHGHGFDLNSHLGVFFCVLKGEFDDFLPWPMQIEITISLIDQFSNLAYTSRTFDCMSAPDKWKYVFQRPASDSECWFGTPQFIHFGFLFDNEALLHNDAIQIRCSTAELH